MSDIYKARITASFLACIMPKKQVLSAFCLCLMIIFMPGCQYAFEFRPDSEIRQEVIEQDPSFANVLKKKSELDEKINSLNSELSLKANEVKSKILALRRELSVFKEHTIKQIDFFNSQLDPDRSDIDQMLLELSAEYRLKQSSLAAINKMIDGLKKLSQQSQQAADSADDASKWQDKINYQAQQADILKQEIDILRNDIRLLRLKQRLLRPR